MLAARAATPGTGRSGNSIPRRTGRTRASLEGADHPVVCVSHNDVVAFLDWLNNEEKGKKRRYRLRTEAQWEYACRAGTTALYGGSDDPESLVRIANVADASLKETEPRRRLHPSGRRLCICGTGGFVRPNGWNLYDMIGNVWEWCDDWYDEAYYQRSPTDDPHNTAKAPDRVIRGGSCDLRPRFGRPAGRSRLTPADQNCFLGFRVAAALPVWWMATPDWTGRSPDLAVIRSARQTMTLAAACW